MDCLFASVWEAVADDFPHDNALICGEDVVTWGEFDERASHIAALLREHGVQEGANVAIYAHNSNEYVESIFAALKLNGTPVPLSHRYKADELVELLERSAAQAVIFQGCFAARIWEVRKQLPKVKVFVQVDDRTESLLNDAVELEQGIRDSSQMPRSSYSADKKLFVSSGGAFGMPKMAVYEECDVVQQLLEILNYVNTSQLRDFDAILAHVKHLKRDFAESVSYPLLPIANRTSYQYGVLLPLLLGGCVVTMNRPESDGHGVLNCVDRQRVTDLTIGGNVDANMLLDALREASRDGYPYRLRDLKTIYSSEALWTEDMKLEILDHCDVRLIDIFGSVEGCYGVSRGTRNHIPDSGIFEKLEGVHIEDEQGVELPSSSAEMGRLNRTNHRPVQILEVSQVFGSYMNTESVQGGSRDYASHRPNNCFQFLGRVDNRIRGSGSQIFVETLEEQCKKHPLIEDCTVVSVDGDREEPTIVALVAVDEETELNQQEFLEFLLSETGGTPVITDVLVLYSTRRNSNRKPDYVWARNTATAWVSSKK